MQASLAPPSPVHADRAQTATPPPPPVEAVNAGQSSLYQPAGKGAAADGASPWPVFVPSAVAPPGAAAAQQQTDGVPPPPPSCPPLPPQAPVPWCLMAWPLPPPDGGGGGGGGAAAGAPPPVWPSSPPPGAYMLPVAGPGYQFPPPPYAAAAAAGPAWQPVRLPSPAPAPPPASPAPPPLPSGSVKGLATMSAAPPHSDAASDTHSVDGATEGSLVESTSCRTLSQRSLCDDDGHGEHGGALGVAGVRVLLAEDNLINQLVAKKTLGALGAKVTIVSNGAEAVAAVTGAAVGAAPPPGERGCAAFDVVLMDMAMPVMDGVDAAAEIRRQGCTVPIVAMTANISDRDQALCREAGMDGFLSKPILKARLGRAIKRAVTRGESLFAADDCGDDDDAAAAPGEP